MKLLYIYFLIEADYLSECSCTQDITVTALRLGDLESTSLHLSHIFGIIVESPETSVRILEFRGGGEPFLSVSCRFQRGGGLELTC